jgi:hypothetical protein
MTPKENQSGRSGRSERKLNVKSLNCRVTDGGTNSSLSLVRGVARPRYDVNPRLLSPVFDFSRMVDSMQWK